MSLNDVEVSRLLAEDGLGDANDEARAIADGHDVDGDRAFRCELRSALAPGTVPSITDAVMARLGAEPNRIGDAVREGAVPSIADTVMSTVTAQPKEIGQVAAAIRAESGAGRTLWSGIAPAVGADVGSDIGALLRGSVAAEGSFESSGWMSPRRRFAVGGIGVAVAAAAAVLMSIGVTGSDGVGPAATSAMTPILSAPVDIEDLEVGASNLVQVLQFGDDAPTIIFVSEDAEDER